MADNFHSLDGMLHIGGMNTGIGSSYEKEGKDGRGRTYVKVQDGDQEIYLSIADIVRKMPDEMKAGKSETALKNEIESLSTQEIKHLIGSFIQRGSQEDKVGHIRGKILTGSNFSSSSQVSSIASEKSADALPEGAYGTSVVHDQAIPEGAYGTSVFFDDEASSIDARSLSTSGIGSFFASMEAKKDAILQDKEVKLRHFQEQGDKRLSSHIESVLKQGGRLEQAQGGIGAAYFLKDKSDKILFVIKPDDEDINRDSNKKGHAELTVHGATDQARMRVGIPTDQTTEREAAAHGFVAVVPGLETVVPQTSMVVIKNYGFNVASAIGDQAAKRGVEKEDFSLITSSQQAKALLSERGVSIAYYEELQGLSEEVLKRVSSEMKAPEALGELISIQNKFKNQGVVISCQALLAARYLDPNNRAPRAIAQATLSGAQVDKLYEKPCSCQKFVENSMDFGDLLEKQDANRELKEAKKPFTPFKIGKDEFDKFQFDQQSFEDVCLATAMTGDTDAHLHQFMVIPKEIKTTADGSRVASLSFTKIDNGLTLPEQNKEFANVLPFFDEARKPISEKTREMMRGLPREEQLKALRRNGLSEACVTAYLERAELLRKLADLPEMTAEQMLYRLFVLQNEGLSQATRKEPFTQHEIIRMNLHASLMMDEGEAQEALEQEA